jgi:catechol 2,3-dioxygenase-like lactoylglutathione lyase family enzyme
MPSIKTLAHICLLARDLEATETFYCEHLELANAFTFTKENRPFGFYLRLDERRFIEVFLAGDRPPTTEPRIHHFCLECDDVDGLRERLTAAGIECTEIKLGVDQSWQFWCKDPDGNELEFHQYTPDSLQFRGGNAEVNW